MSVRYVGGMMIGISNQKTNQNAKMSCNLCTTCYGRIVSSRLFFDDEPSSEKEHMARRNNTWTWGIA